VLVRAAPGLADETRGMGIIHHHECVIFFAQVANFFQRRNIPIHREHTVRGYQSKALLLSFLQSRFQIGHVHVLVDISLCFRQANAVNNRSMVQLIGDDGVFFLHQRFEEPAVRIKARAIQNRIFHAQKIRNLALQILVYFLRAANKPHAAHAIAPAI
jgi:hypothetical protein